MILQPVSIRLTPTAAPLSKTADVSDGATMTQEPDQEPDQGSARGPGRGADPDRLRALEERLRAARKAQEPDPPSDAMETFSQAHMAWRMIIELVVGIGIGVGLGYGLDEIFGTQPWMLVVFTLLGFAAGVNVMLQSAREMNRAAEAGAAKAGGSDAPGMPDARREMADETTGGTSESMNETNEKREE